MKTKSNDKLLRAVRKTGGVTCACAHGGRKFPAAVASERHDKLRMQHLVHRESPRCNVIIRQVIVAYMRVGGYARKRPGITRLAARKGDRSRMRVKRKARDTRNQNSHRFPGHLEAIHLI